MPCPQFKSGSGDHIGNASLWRGPRSIERLSVSCCVLSHGSGEHFRKHQIVSLSTPYREVERFQSYSLSWERGL
jgi:hypothetical protein